MSEIGVGTLLDFPIAGEVELLEMIRSGGSSYVYKGADTDNNIFAVKVVRANAVADGITQRVFNEINNPLPLSKHIIKAKNYEFEYKIPKKDGELIISEIENPIIKERFHLRFKEKEWIIDRFKGKNFPLEIAEVELKTIQEQINLPSFLSTEITGLKKFSNFELFNKPFSSWGKKIY